MSILFHWIKMMLLYTQDISKIFWNMPKISYFKCYVSFRKTDLWIHHVIIYYVRLWYTDPIVLNVNASLVPYLENFFSMNSSHYKYSSVWCIVIAVGINNTNFISQHLSFSTLDVIFQIK